MNHYEGADGRLLAGEWRCDPGAWRLVYDPDEYEFCQILEGHIRLTDEAGRAREYRAGDAFVIEAGFRGTWETLSYCRKHYVICRIPAA
nr:cupin domain-containing protein [Niveibacterium umoris]